MLEQIERNPRVFIQGHNLTVQKGAGRERFAGTGDMRKLLREKVFSPDKRVTAVESLPARQR
jgi:hypothetical protein